LKVLNKFGFKEMKALNRVLCKIGMVTKSEADYIELGLDTALLLEIEDSLFSSNYGLIKLAKKAALFTDYYINLNTHLAQKLDIAEQDYLEIVHMDKTLFLVPIASKNLISDFYNIYGAKEPRIIVLSSHPDYETYTREIATEIYHRLQDHATPALRIEPRERVREWNQKLDLTISRFDVDITRNQDMPELIGTNLINKNPSYRIIAELYFQLLSQVLSTQEKQIVVDIHGIANTSSRGIFHPMVLVGDASTQNPLVKTFVKTIEKSSRTVLPNLWIPYRSLWGSVEYSLQLVKNTSNIPIIIEIRSDLREKTETRNQLIDLIAKALINLMEHLTSISKPHEMTTYRRFQPSDLDQIFSVYTKSFSWLYGAKVPDYASQFVTIFRAAFNEGADGEMFVAEQEGALIGFAVIHREATDEWKFGPIAVVPAFQREAIGSHLLELCIDFARSNDVKSFYLKVHEHNLPAIKLYKKFGFTVTEIVPSSLTSTNFLKMILSVGNS